MRLKYFVSFVYYEFIQESTVPAQFGNTFVEMSQPICTKEQITELTDAIRNKLNVGTVTILHFTQVFP